MIVVSPNASFKALDAVTLACSGGAVFFASADASFIQHRIIKSMKLHVNRPQTKVKLVKITQRFDILSLSFTLASINYYYLHKKNSITLFAFLFWYHSTLSTWHLIRVQVYSAPRLNQMVLKAFATCGSIAVNVTSNHMSLSTSILSRCF